MAEPYLTRLEQFIDELGPPFFGGSILESNHFFNGAALYIGGKMLGSLSPSDFALKLPTDTRKDLIETGGGMEFRFFTTGPVKREYVALSDSTVDDRELVRELITLGIDHVSGG
jgi:hypothetical protein